MEILALARVIHVLSIILWIGGVAMVTTVIIPSVKKLKSADEQLDTFEQIEGRFSLQAKITTLIAGITGFYLVIRMGIWDRFTDLTFWWMHAMLLVWFLFTLVLFVFEPLVLRKLFRSQMAKDPARTFRIIHRAHWILLMVSLLAAAGAVAGGHGWYFI